MGYKKRSFSILTFLLISRLLFAAGPSIYLGDSDSTGFKVKFEEHSQGQKGPHRFFRIYTFEFQGCSQLLLAASEDGKILRDLWSFPSKSDQFVAMGRSFDEEVDALGEGWVPIFPSNRSSNQRQFRITADGKYYFFCLVKPAKNMRDGVRYSNILELEINGGKILSSSNVTKEEIPNAVREAFANKLRAVAAEEKVDLKLLDIPLTK